MNIQISIVFENVKYLTFYGSDYLTEQFPDTNVIPFADVVTKASYQVSLNKLWPGHKFNQFPLLENAKISRLGQYLQGEGTVTVDGVTYDVKLTPNSITATEQGGSTALHTIPHQDNCKKSKQYFHNFPFPFFHLANQLWNQQQREVEEIIAESFHNSRRKLSGNIAHKACHST